MQMIWGSLVLPRGWGLLRLHVEGPCALWGCGVLQGSYGQAMGMVYLSRRRSTSLSPGVSKRCSFLIRASSIMFQMFWNLGIPPLDSMENPVGGRVNKGCNIKGRGVFFTEFGWESEDDTCMHSLPTRHETHFFEEHLNGASCSLEPQVPKSTAQLFKEIPSLHNFLQKGILPCLIYHNSVVPIQWRLLILLTPEQWVVNCSIYVED